MEWNKGYTASYHCEIINPRTWQDAERAEVVSGSISRENSGLRESADLILDRRYDREQYIRLYLTASQNSDRERVALFTGLAVSPNRDIDGNTEEYKYECYSVLKPCDDVFLARGWYAPASISCENIIRDLLRTTPAPIEINGIMPSLSTAIIAEDNETNLSMIEKILTAIGWIIRIGGDGTITIQPQPDAVVASFDAVENDIVEPQLSVDDDWFDAPNVFRAISDDLVAIARDDAGDDMLSVEGRGREVWAQDTSVDLNDGESIEAYAIRRLREEQVRKKSVSYKRRFLPDVAVGDSVSLHYPKQDINGIFQVKSQKIDIGFSCTTSEEVVEK